MTRLFVYGTLKRGCNSHAFLAGQTFVSEARTVAGYRMFLLDGYPGMVVTPEDTEGVTGELWSVDEECLAALDAFEGVHEDLYRRQSLTLITPMATADAYVYLRTTVGRSPLGPVWTE